MKKIEITNKTPSGFPVVYEAKYPFAPDQFVLLRWYSLFDDSYILIPAIITHVIDDDYSTFQSRVKVFNKWACGSLSGAIDMTIVVHRYVNSEDKIESKHYNLIPEISDHPQSIFYIEKCDDSYFKCYPFKKESADE